MEIDAEKIDGDDFGYCSSNAISPKNVSSKKNDSKKRKRRRPRTKALRRAIKEKVNLFHRFLSYKMKKIN